MHHGCQLHLVYDHCNLRSVRRRDWHGPALRPRNEHRPQRFGGDSHVRYGRNLRSDSVFQRQLEHVRMGTPDHCPLQHDGLLSRPWNRPRNGCQGTFDRHAQGNSRFGLVRLIRDGGRGNPVANYVLPGRSGVQESMVRPEGWVRCGPLPAAPR